MTRSKSVAAAFLLCGLTFPSVQACSGHSIKDGRSAPVVDAISNQLVITEGGQVLWNQVPVSLNELEGLLQQTAELEDEPELQFLPEIQSDYALSTQVLNVIMASGVTKFGFVGNEKAPVESPD